MVQTDLATLPKKPAPPLFGVPRASDWNCFANLVPRYLDRNFGDIGISNCRKNWELSRELAGCGFGFFAIDRPTPDRTFSYLHRLRIGRDEPLSQRLGRLGLQKVQKARRRKEEGRRPFDFVQGTKKEEGRKPFDFAQGTKKEEGRKPFDFAQGTKKEEGRRPFDFVQGTKKKEVIKPSTLRLRSGRRFTHHTNSIKGKL